MKKFFLFWMIFLFVTVFSGFFLLAEIRKFEKENSQFFLTQTSIFFPQRQARPIILFFVGDIMLTRGVENMIKKYGQGDYKFPFLKIAEELREADILFGNLEGPISDKGRKVGSIYSFRNDPKVIEGLNFAGFDILSAANNHIFDYGREAMEDTFLRLKEAKIDVLGGGFNEKEACGPLIKEVGKTKIGFLAFTNLGSSFWSATENKSGICWLEKEKMKEKIKEAKEMADLVIVSFHYGEEYFLKPTDFQVSISKMAVDSGANLVIGHHPHVIQEIKEYKEGYITYSLGNFVFDQGFSEKTMKGLLLKVIVENVKIKEIIPIEIKINQFFQPEVVK